MRRLNRKVLILFVAVLAVGILLAWHDQMAYAAARKPTVKTHILGIQSDGQIPYPGISWLRLSYTTCGNSTLSGQVLQDTIRSYHEQGIRILLVVCQPDLSTILDPTYLKDAAQGRADAVHGNPKPLRQDLPMGARVLDLMCSFRTVEVAQQEQLLALLYARCQLPSNYVALLES